MTGRGEDVELGGLGMEGNGREGSGEAMKEGKERVEDGKVRGEVS